jgi:hypothetical protein
MPNSLRRTAIRGRASQRSCAPVERIDLRYQPIAQRRPGRGKWADARPRRLDAPIFLRKILDPYGTVAPLQQAQRFKASPGAGTRHRSAGRTVAPIRKPPYSTPGDLVFSACGRIRSRDGPFRRRHLARLSEGQLLPLQRRDRRRARSHFSVAASLFGGTGRSADQPALRDLARDLAAGLDRLVHASDAAGQAASLHSAPASCMVGAQCREAYRQPANSTGSSRRRQ